MFNHKLKEENIEYFFSESYDMLSRIVKDTLKDLEDKQIIMVTQVPVIARVVYKNGKAMYTKKELMDTTEGRRPETRHVRSPRRRGFVFVERAGLGGIAPVRTVLYNGRNSLSSGQYENRVSEVRPDVGVDGEDEGRFAPSV